MIIIFADNFLLQKVEVSICGPIIFNLVPANAREGEGEGVLKLLRWWTFWIVSVHAF